MPENVKTALLLNTDPMVRKGMELLLTDMHFNVISSSDTNDLKNKLSNTSIKPDILIFPLLIGNAPSIYFIRSLRKNYQQKIPAIILNNGVPMHKLFMSDENITVLEDQVKPATLREKISESITCPIN